jgi:aspartyl-tRNA(Asn)/glutamyl-tRNA(Gln) amidotransferase subunit A
MPEPRTITEAAEFIRRGELSPVELLEQCLARIDKYEDRVKAWVYLDRAGAREQAERLTAELKRGERRGPLHGIPIGVKDIIDVFDMPTGCGSKLWANSYARRDSTVVERLRQAGAVIMGKTVTTAFASFDPPVTRNPWNLERTPGGSSSGSAAAVACGMCLGALASQTGGSITRPASYCGVYGLKPTYGRVSAAGVMPLAPSMDHVGVMANCVRDLAVLLQTIAGPDTRDTSCEERIVPDYVAECAKPATSFRLGRLGGLFDERASREMIAAMDAIEEPLADADVWLYRASMTPELPDILRRHRAVMAVEAATYHRERFARHPEDYPPRISDLVREGLACPATEYRDHLYHQMRWAFTGHGLLFVESQETVAYITPATTGAAPDASTTGDPAFNSVWSYLGWPTVSLPIAWSSEGLPLCAQVVGPRFCEHELLRGACAVEAAIGFTPRPLPL